MARLSFADLATSSASLTGLSYPGDYEFEEQTFGVSGVWARMSSICARVWVTRCQDACVLLCSFATHVPWYGPCCLRFMLV